EGDGGRGGGEEGQVVAVAALGGGQVLDEGGPDVPRLQGRGHRAAHVEQGEDGSGREEAGQGEKHLLPAAHAGEPVVDERDLQGCSGQRVSEAAIAGTAWPRAFR